MPISHPIRNEVADAGLDHVIEAVAAVADTLARLQDAHDLGHRDVKPPNLYELGGEWLIGDFGLIDIPEGEDLTGSGKPVGSRHYTPWEMISNPAGASSHPADVYALGKTLWVLATGQNYPPEGPQPAGVRGLSIGDYRPHPYDLALDRLIERMTLRDPSARPTKREVADELRTWLELPTPTPNRDVSEVRAKIREKLATEISAEEMRDRWRTAHRDAWKRFEERYNATINEMLRQVHPRPALDRHDDKLTMNTMRTTHAFQKDYLKQLYRCSSISIGDPAIRYALRAGRGLEVFDDGELKIHAFVDVGYPAHQRHRLLLDDGRDLRGGREHASGARDREGGLADRDQDGRGPRDLRREVPLAGRALIAAYSVSAPQIRQWTGSAQSSATLSASLGWHSTSMRRISSNSGGGSEGATGRSPGVYVIALPDRLNRENLLSISTATCPRPTCWMYSTCASVNH